MQHIRADLGNADQCSLSLLSAEGKKRLRDVWEPLKKLHMLSQVLPGCVVSVQQFLCHDHIVQLLVFILGI